MYGGGRTVIYRRYKMKKINILGTEWTILFSDERKDKILERCDGYCDKTSHRIVVTSEPEDNELKFFTEYQKKVIRHEIIHAFLFESGLHGCMNTEKQSEHDEQMVDWIAAQFPKLLKVFHDADCI